MGEMFTHPARIWFDELDAMRILHNSRYAVHVERAMTAWFDAMGHPFADRVEDNPDQFHAVREFHIEFVAPFRGPGELVVELWLERLGITSASYGFRLLDGATRRTLANGRRGIVKLDPRTFAPAPWTDEFVQGHAALALRTPAEPAAAAGTERAA